MLRNFALRGIIGLLLAAPALADDVKYTVKEGQAAPPKELKKSIAELLSDQVVQIVDGNGKPYCEIWFCKEVAAKSAPVNYRKIEQSTLVGAIRIAQKDGWTDFRGQKIAAGVYTLRIGFQPDDGDHMGTAVYKEFCLLAPAGDDDKPDLIKDKKALYELSEKASGKSHPAVMMLQPSPKPVDKARLVEKPGNTTILEWKINVNAGRKKEMLGIGLTLFGKSESA